MADSLCEDPADLSLVALKLIAKCLDAELRFIFIMCRASIGIALDTVELVILTDSVLEDYTKDNMGLKIGLNLGIAALTVGALLIIGSLGGTVIFIEESGKRRATNRFFIAH